MQKKTTDAEMSPLVKAGIVVSAIALFPALYVASQLNDDSAIRAKERAERTAAQEAKYEKIMHEELNRRLGNR
ncbi:hypothetical protein GCM10011390_38010 [Aureimonas endophytica]|uniref:Uncharacterized protein n=1 Tax=Aureimonas endophytica TaxID=2027858 RepID=A0A916ZV32_9HYPH|nr:hypothetical protein [Aureimonas endophytica]GGE15293.1 hypothetical protein GCM10011390_38010 [Aureimonas endophytica]